MKKKKKITKKKVIIAIIIVVIAIFIFTNANKNNNEEVSKPEIETIEKRTIAKSISATGTINSTNTKNVVSTLTGSEILSVNVKKGDKINVGDVICTFDTSTLQQNLNIAQASQSTSQAQANLGVESAHRNLSDAIANKNTQVNNSQQDINSAKTAYDNAVNQLNNINNSIVEKQHQLNSYAGQQADFASVEQNYNSKKIKFENATNEYNARKAEYEAGVLNGTIIENTPDANDKKQNLTVLESNVKLAESEYLTAQTEYNTKQATFTPVKSQYEALASEVASLQAQKAQIEPTISQLKATYDKMITAYNSVVSTADSTIESMKDNVKNSELAASSSSLASASQINTLKDQIADGVVKSTVSGTVTNVNVKKGDLYTGTAIATIEGTEEFIVEAEIDEYDIPDIEIGMKVLIKTDATRDEEMEGRITYVASSATNNAVNAGMATTGTAVSNATYKVEIALDSANDRLRLGMNAKLSIITEMEEDVWSVPYNAVYNRDNGTHYIEIAKDDTGENKEELDVTLGIQGSYYIQIKSDKLKPDMKVVLPKIEAGDSMNDLLEMMGADAGM
jgi:HlyD family secretion protein